MNAKALTPILNVSDLAATFAWFEKLGWKKCWDWGEPPTFGAVGSGECRIFLCQGAQGGRGRGTNTTTFQQNGDEAADKGAWMSMWVEDVDEIYRRCTAEGLDVTFPPADMPWNVREMHVRHPDGHVFRVSKVSRDNAMDEKRAMLKHFLAALAYRTQKALRDAPEGFGEFGAGMKVRTPHELVRHMDSLMGYARTHFVGGSYRPRIHAEFKGAIADFHAVLEDVARHLDAGTEFLDTTPERMLQGPFSDAMTHAGQLALLRRLAGCPVAPENFIVAKISPENLGPEQPLPASPDKEWPEKL